MKNSSELEDNKLDHLNNSNETFVKKLKKFLILFYQQKIYLKNINYKSGYSAAW